MEGDDNNQKGLTMTLKRRRGKTSIIESPTHPPPNRLKRDKKTSSVSCKDKSLFKDHLSYMNDATLAFARKRYISLTQLNVATEKFVNEDDLDEPGVKGRVLELIERGGFGGFWRLRGDIWEEIVREIYATMKINSDKKFCLVCLRGRPLHMSFHEFAEACGAYERESNDVGSVAPESCWSGGAASELGMSKNKFWSELCGQEGLKFVGGVSKISNVKDVSIRIVHRWLVTSICGRNAKDGAVTVRELTCLFGMVKGIDFDKAKLLLLQMRANREKKKGEIYGGLYLTHFVKRFHERLPGITIIKPIKACTIRYLKGNHSVITKSKTTKDATPNGQPSEFHRGNPSEDDYRQAMNHLPLITVSETEERPEDTHFHFEPPPPMTPQPKHNHEEMTKKIKERRAYDFRKEQLVQREMLKNIMDNITWMKEETMDFFQKAGHCFSKPPPTYERPPEINQEQFFRNFEGEEEVERSHLGGSSVYKEEESRFDRWDKSIGGCGERSARNESTPVVLSPPSSTGTVVLDRED